MNHSTTTPTKAERAHMDRIKDRGVCVCCWQRGYRIAGLVEIHHLLSGNKRRGHLFTVGLCAWHHRALPPFGWGDAEAEYELGPSLANGSKPFRAVFGSDDDLMALQERIWSGEA